MRVVIAPDSFKEGCTAMAAAEAIAQGWAAVRPHDQLEKIPMADGGEGTVAAVTAAWQLGELTAYVTGPLGEKVAATYAYDASQRLAVIEMAAASGLELVPHGRRDPRYTTTRGIGELIVHALDQGAQRIILGVGGSATNDGGAGALEALGFRFLDEAGIALPPGGAALSRLHHLDHERKHPRLGEVKIDVACDVSNPLCGEQGASLVYAPQKGASPEVARELDRALAHYAAVVNSDSTIRHEHTPGAGAAGGLAFGLLSLAGATLKPGVELVAEAVGLAQRICGADLVITGEGKLDAQTLNGKTPFGVARMAAGYGVPVLALAGELGRGFETLLEHGVTSALAISPKDMPLADALRETASNLRRVASEVAKQWPSLSLETRQL